MQSWQLFKDNFSSIIKDTSAIDYQQLLQEIVSTPNNKLLYSVHGFPIDLYVDEILKQLFNIQSIYRNKTIWNKTVPYVENQYFFELDLMHPDIRSDFSFLKDLVLHIVQIKNIMNKKHLFVIKHIEHLQEYFFEFRILLERYSANVVFLCTTHAISQIEEPIRSRFNMFRIPLFTELQISNIFSNYIKKPVPSHCRRDIIKALFFADIPTANAASAASAASTSSTSTYNFPPLYDYMKTFDKKKNNLQDVRTLAYKCCQYNISILQLVSDFIRLVEDLPRKKRDLLRYKIITISADIDHRLSLTNSCREPIYIECFLCQILFNSYL